jgi:hypothetical protein
LTGRACTGKLKSMRCLNFAAAVAILPVAAGEAQRVPGRDLLDYPIGTLAEAPALALDSGDGFQNPAAIRLAEGTKLRGTAIALNSGTDRGVSAQLLGVAAKLPSRFTVGLSAVHAEISGIAQTADDPQPIGGEIPYNTFVLSLTGARESTRHVTSGVALRYRTGEVDGVTRSTFGLDGGVLVDRLFGLDARFGLSSFLWGPGSGEGQDASFSGALDSRVIGADSTRQARVGYSYTASEGASGGHYVFAMGRFSRWIARAGVARTSVYGTSDTSLRLALVLRYARYTVGLSREESAGGFDPTYQFVLSGVFR